MTPELIDELVATAANLASLLVMLPPAEAARNAAHAHAYMLAVMSDGFGDDIGQAIAGAAPRR
jgi:hypothetical protein